MATGKTLPMQVAGPRIARPSMILALRDTGFLMQIETPTTSGIRQIFKPPFLVPDLPGKKAQQDIGSELAG